ncbi:hypothetical protein CRENBAI_013640 [Crenichthys baileyi]|uniref:Uncharacterized protein n=1 Tax=Crenichthys baileyi TaxID=28760 RepID=A0AAV9RS04_9TELE
MDNLSHIPYPDFSTDEPSPVPVSKFSEDGLPLVPEFSMRFEDELSHVPVPTFSNEDVMVDSSHVSVPDFSYKSVQMEPPPVPVTDLSYKGVCGFSWFPGRPLRRFSMGSPCSSSH